METSRTVPLPGLARIREAVQELAAAHDLRLVVLFGSLARQQAKPADVDLAILADDPLDLVDLGNALIQRLGTQHVDLTELRRADPLLLALVARDGIALHEAEPGEFNRFASLAMRRFADTAKFRQAERAYLEDFIRESGVLQ